MGPRFDETQRGRKFYDRDLPMLIKAIQENTAELKRANDLKEKMISDREIINCIENTVMEHLKIIIPIEEEGVPDEEGHDMLHDSRSEV